MVNKKTNDPVCGMDLSGLKDLDQSSHRGEKFYFCSSWCRNRFKKNPEKFLGEPLVKLREVWKTFLLGDVKVNALRGLNLNIWEGDFIAIIGASGSGKSTALHMVGLLDRPTSGSIYLKGEDTSLFLDEKRALTRSITFGFVFQQYNLIPWLTAYENASLPLIFSKKKANFGSYDDKHTIEDRFREIGLGQRMGHRPTELSGGEQQRTAILRALANDPEVILGDEPTGNLDSETGEKILDLLIDLNKDHGKTLIVVTHDAGIAGRADQVIALKDGHVVRDHGVYKKMYTE